MINTKIYLTVLLFFFLQDISFSQISPYQSGIIDYSGIKPSSSSSSQSLSFQYLALCKKQLEYDISVASKYANYCIKSNNCSNYNVDLSHSSWITQAYSYAYQNIGYTVILLKNNKMYFFNYIPPNTLEAWKNSSSPGNFYNRYIKYNYRFSECMSYEP